MASFPPWPFDDEDRPSGSVRPLSQADLQAILAHLNREDPDQLLAGTDAAQPVVAIRVRATVGRPGGSAQAQWRRLRAAEWAAWIRTLSWRVAVILGVGAGGGVLGSLLAPRLGLVVAALAVAAVGWGLRFRPSPDAVAWRRGAAGERRTARLLGPLERHGWVVLHDLAVPGSRANIDHLAIGPGGVFVIDSKQYRGRLQLDRSGRLWHGRYPLAPTVRAASFEADQAAQVLPDPGLAVGACQACCASSRWCWGLSGSSSWPTRPVPASTLPPNPTAAVCGVVAGSRRVERQLGGGAARPARAAHWSGCRPVVTAAQPAVGGSRARSTPPARLKARRDPPGQRIQFGGSALDLGRVMAGLHPATPHPTTGKQKHFSNQEPAAIVLVSES
jgi:hypothetical protein